MLDSFGNVLTFLGWRWNVHLLLYCLAVVGLRTLINLIVKRRDDAVAVCYLVQDVSGILALVAVDPLLLSWMPEALRLASTSPFVTFCALLCTWRWVTANLE